MGKFNITLLDHLNKLNTKKFSKKSSFKFNFVRFSKGGAGVGAGAAHLEQIRPQPQKKAAPAPQH